ncbi:E3 ubiquitin-protein ligase ZSWIM2 [Xiphophorus hellerii]|uniref:E3 ubiquitin-protein ligase ZSWIM2 n=1 Tax=Xiphophorus hellerii TaxID=8084 RepID=UPI0013B3F698|nr:E3 ubiquitin-protein ligase ZSWIM2 [Xiphophorus hellerii]XP_032413031.1 E3 ubiquitin-protein ligase ZSWIM2 [Xiphophorus hellerii]XP_032413033.1 E3 ubiquitin-protein ligase ZSWIM2 [Xiphophorus hellerii]
MSRRTGWRNVPSDTVSSHQDQALGSTVFLLRSFGPTAFLLREDGETATFKVCLGERHTCTCPTFAREQQPCKHICWLLLRKFRLPREHQYAFQAGLSERQLLEVLQGSHQAIASAAETPHQSLPGQETGVICRKEIQNRDVCPICLEGLLQKKQPVCYCRYGCGNSVHISCMKVWADHQGLSDGREMLRCPLCRECFSSLQLLQEQAKNVARLFTAAERERAERHLGVVCCSCRVGPVTGTCYRCCLCSSLYLCETCATQGSHSQHPLATRKTRKEEWTPASAGSSLDPEPQDGRCVQEGFSSCSAHVVAKCCRLLLSAPAEPPADVVLKRVPAAVVRRGSRLLDEGMQCRICLRGFGLGQRLRTLPCQHKFHVDCVDQILLRSRSCPLDGYVIYCQRPTDRKSSPEVASVPQQEDRLKDLFVPGIALLAQNTKPSPACGAPNSEVPMDGSSFSCLAPNTLKKTRGGMAARKAKVHPKDADEETVRDATGDGLELRMTGFSINKQ